MGVKEVRCVERFKDNKDRVIGYNLVDKQNERYNIRADRLKQLIRHGAIIVTNLELTKDNRLVIKK